MVSVFHFTKAPFRYCTTHLCLQHSFKPSDLQNPSCKTCNTLGLELLHSFSHGLLRIHLELGDVLLHRIIKRLLGDLLGAHFPGGWGGCTSVPCCRERALLVSVQNLPAPTANKARGSFSLRTKAQSSASKIQSKARPVLYLTEKIQRLRGIRKRSSSISGFSWGFGICHRDRALAAARRAP